MSCCSYVELETGELPDVQKLVSEKKSATEKALQHKPQYDSAKVVYVQMYLNHIYDVDVMSGTFKIDVDAEFLWKKDEKEEENEKKEKDGKEDGKEEEEEEWKPNIEACNIIEGEREGEAEASIEKDLFGQTLTSREFLFLCTCKSRMEIASFPFDRHVVKLIIRSMDQPKSELEFKALEEKVNCDRAELHSPEYKIGNIFLETKTHIYQHVVATEGLEAATYSEVSLNIELQREPGYYYMKLITPIHLIFIMALAVPMLPPDKLGSRTGLVSGLVLAAVGLMYTAAAYLPKTSVSSHVDHLLAQQMVVLVGEYVETMVVFQMHSYKLTKWAVHVDYGLLGLLCVFLLFSFSWWYLKKHA